MNLEINATALELLRQMFVEVEGQCEVWTDDEIARRVFIRGAMEYAKSSGKAWDDVMAIAAQLREQLSAT